MLLNGINLANNGEFTKSDSLFNAVIDRFPNSPSGFHYLSQNHFWKFLGSRDEAEMIVFKKMNELAEMKAKNILLKSNSSFYNFILASVYSLRAAANTTEGDSWNAFLNVKESVGILEDILEKDSTFYDAYLNLGIFNYALSFVPGLFKFALDITGLDYDKEKALRFLKLAYENGYFTRDEAAFHLSKINFEYTGNYTLAMQLIDELISKYPGNVLFSYQKALIEIESKNLESAKSLLLNIVNSGKDEFKQTIAFSYFLLGDIYFKQNNFRKSVEYYEQYFASTSVLDFIGYANLRAALAYKILDDSEKFRFHLDLAGNGNLNIPEDEFAKEEAIKIKEMTGVKGYLNLIKSDNLFQSGKYTELIDFVDSLKLPHEMTIYKFFALVELEQLDSASALKQKVDNLVLPGWLDAYKNLYLGKLLYLSGSNEEAEKYFEKVNSYEGYRSGYLKSQVYYLSHSLSK